MALKVSIDYGMAASGPVAAGNLPVYSRSIWPQAVGRVMP